MPNIYIPNYSPSNKYESAKQHGDFVIMTKGILVDDPNSLQKLFRDYFHDAQSGDILMFSGPHIVCAIAYAEWEKRFPFSRLVMQYKKGTDSYTIITLD